MKTSRKIRAFTLIELLVVVLILAILTAVALPLYLKSVKDAEEKACQTNMKTIANAVQANHVRDRTGPYWEGAVTGVSAVGQPLEDLQNDPTCPADSAAYTVLALGLNDREGFKITCASSSPHTFYWEAGKIFTP